MEKITLYIGLNDKDSKTQKVSYDTAIKCVYNILCANGIDGATMYNANGIYRHENGEIVFENTLRCELINPSNTGLNNAITVIKRVLNQESIIKQYETITSEFI